MRSTCKYFVSCVDFSSRCKRRAYFLNLVYFTFCGSLLIRCTVSFTYTPNVRVRLSFEVLHSNMTTTNSMSSASGIITDLTLRLGLRAAVTKVSADWQLKPAVHELYGEGIDRISRNFYGKSKDDMRKSESLRRESLRLLRRYGTAIWGRPGRDSNRPWLFTPGHDQKPGDSRPRGLYQQDLNWHDKEHMVIGVGILSLRAISLT